MSLPTKVCAFFRGEIPQLPDLPDALRHQLALASEKQLNDDPLPYDGALEWWFAETVPAEASRKALTGLLGARLVGYYQGHEHLIMPETAAAQAQGYLKSVFAFRHNPSMSFADFTHYWRERHAPIVPRTPELAGYAQIHLNNDQSYSDNAPGFTAITELYWRDHAAMEIGMASKEMTEEQSSDAEIFADRASISMAVLECPTG